MDKIWLDQYPEGVPAEADVEAYQSIKEIFEESVRKYRDLPAFENMGTVITYAELDQRSRYFAAYLQKVLGLQKGDPVAIMMPNCLQYPVALFGILRAGLTVVNVNPLYTERELKHQLKDSGAKAIVIVENFCKTLQSVIDETEVRSVLTTRLGDMLGFPKSMIVNFVVRHIKKMVPEWDIPSAQTFERAISEGKWQTLEDVTLSRDDTAFLQYTGGTTGLAKGAVLTHGNMVANMQQAAAWLGDEIEEGREIVVTALPLYHIFSLTANCMVFMRTGGKNLLITNPRDIPTFIKTIRKSGFTAITGVNTLFNALLNHPDFKSVDFSRLKMALGGGMAVQRVVAERWEEVTGAPMLEAYGLTETSPAVTINPLNIKDFTGSIGLPIPNTEVIILDDEGNVLPQGESGELAVRGPQVMKEYLNQPEETKKTFTEDGFFKTGDVAKMDEKGFVYIVDRKKDMINVSGFNVYPNEIEEVASGIDGVLEVAAIGIPDEKSGEVVKLWVVRKDESLTEEKIIEHCREQLTGYKVPKKVAFAEELPKTNVGKILRRKLREDDPDANEG
ncbi:AMP-binding protein [Natronospira bacteriovora]|uniref:Long-chain-fatty-acid--CoA ligase n=1 Tax=Natronospira bacteriovora TaxID=3069753 RepID=A0ABU0W8X9_9GAMM|nr:AMP-binding protein [Natronospira sp. AB-CW4]MDQ2070213.1 AMP-binding protein [Natronospira sp. AB-CW4]